MNRFYHALNSRFNIYFNGKMAFDEALLSMQTGYKENYSDMILMYPISAQPKDKSEPGGPFDVAIEKSNKAIKLHSIQTKPKKKPGWRNDPKQVAWQNQEEYNPFLKKCWMLMGEAQFYNADFLQASATFSYITRHYKEDPEIVASAKLWQARCYAEMGWNYEAEDILNKLNTEGIPKKNLDQYATVYADYLIKNGQFEEAIPYMKTAIKAEKNRLQKKRMKYLLGQMYATLEMDGMAYKTFGEVIRSNPPYELEFAARIRQTEVFTGTNFQKMVKKLERMVRDRGIGGVRFFPATSDVEPHYRSASIFVLPSRSEAFGNVLLEAMSVGLPVVSFDCGAGPRDIILPGQTGVFVPPGDTESMAGELDRLMADPGRLRRMGNAARESIRRYDRGLIVSQWEDLLIKTSRE